MTHAQVSVCFGFNRTLKQKIWPGIPSPESEFEGLFTTHKGNFQVGSLVVPSRPGASLLLWPNSKSLSKLVLFPQLWLYQTDGCLWWSPSTPFPEDPPAPLEVLSECCWGVTQAVAWMALPWRLRLCLQAGRSGAVSGDPQLREPTD